MSCLAPGHILKIIFVQFWVKNYLASSGYTAQNTALSLTHVPLSVINSLKMLTPFIIFFMLMKRFFPNLNVIQSSDILRLFLFVLFLLRIW